MATHGKGTTQDSAEEYHSQIAVGFFGNILVIYIHAVRLKRSTTHLFITALAVADTVVCIVCIPVEIVVVRYLYSFDIPWLCRVFRTIVLACVTTSISVLISIAVDRYKKGMHSFQVSDFCQKGENCSWYWLYCCYNSCVTLDGHFRQEDGQQNCCRLRMQHKWKKDCESISGLRNGTHKTTFMMFIITAVFILSFVPHLALMATRAVQKHTYDHLEGAPLALYNLFLRTYFINSVSNPIIYGFMSDKFRSQAKIVFRRMCCKK
ncbi:galanin receptor type 1-like [Haliotis rubra]|uniref:galanin receptor type 1-like n=1 Tax=Haliotis rubra TaxID=36100 RepID=UPI001EE62FFE|nr:galanin receptor type 1-like [Haliotis rubra]